jgi:ubiquinone/menaquinone biosynthesis C-methylase UbiE
LASRSHTPKKANPQAFRVELEFLEGLEPFVLREVHRELAGRVTGVKAKEETAVAFTFKGGLRRLLALRTVVAAYKVLSFGVVRPRGLLDPAPLKTIVESLKEAAALHPAGSCRSFRLSAAGSDSATHMRLRSTLATMSGLRDDPENGDLLLRLRKAGSGWELLVRLSPRPLSARPWREANMPGALNATVAASLFECVGFSRNERFLNAMCGSGTILIERLARLPAPELSVGFDHSPAALRAAKRNVAEASLAAEPIVMRSAAEALPFPPSFFDVICADLPWGERVGKRKDNEALYLTALRELTRVSRPGARLVLLTQDTQSLDAAFRGIKGEKGAPWVQCWRSKISQGGYHPTLYVFERDGKKAKPGQR